MNDIEVRLAEIKDVQEIAQVKQKCWATTYRGIYADELIDNFNYDKSINSFTAMINNENMDLYVVVDNHKIVGYMSCGDPYHPYKDYEQELGTLYLLEEYRGQGIGTMLFELAKDIIKRRGYDCFLVSANKYNVKAQEFYKKMGCVEIEVDDDDVDKSHPQIKYRFDLK